MKLEKCAVNSVRLGTHQESSQTSATSEYSQWLIRGFLRYFRIIKFCSSLHCCFQGITFFFRARGFLRKLLTRFVRYVFSNYTLHSFRSQLLLVAGMVGMFNALPNLSEAFMQHGAYPGVPAIECTIPCTIPGSARFS